ncbi:MAG: HD domain-containing protein [bacterium]
MPIKLPKNVIYIIKTLKSKGYEAYAVGGALRDILLHIRTYDYDITTNAKPDQVMSLFNKTVPTGIKYGTVTVILDDGKYEVTTFRRDEAYSDGRRPDIVRFTKNITDDLARRDFTINAMAFDPITDKFIDPFNGRKDIKQKIIRTVGNPLERFSEDGLRPFRACRFAAKLQFKVEPKTLAAIKKSLNKAKIVAPERIREELVKMLESVKPSTGLDLMRRSGLLKLVLPELLKGHKIEQNEFHKYDIYWHNLYSCDAAPKDNMIVRMAALLHDISKPECKEGPTFYGHDQAGVEVSKTILKRLRFSNDDTARILNLIRYHMFEYNDQWSDAAVRRFIKRVGLKNIPDLFTLRKADLSAMGRIITKDHVTVLNKRIKKILKQSTVLKVSDLNITGHDVMRYLKLQPGPKIGKILNELLERVLEDPALNHKFSLLKIIKGIADDIT